jgi:tetratricopeptide (TPR) repeat protein
VTAGAFLLLLFGSATVSTYLAIRANQALVEAKGAKARTDQALQESEESGKQAKAVGEFLVEAFQSPNPTLDGRQVKVADVLDRASERLDQPFAGSQATRGAMLEALGSTYRGLGLYEKAVSLHTKARAVREAALGPDHPDTLASRHNLAEAYLAAGRTAEAVQLHEAMLKLVESRLGPEHAHTLISRANLAVCFQTLARAERDAGRHRQAIGLYRRAIAIEEDLARRSPGTSEHQEVLAWFLTDFGMCSREAGLRPEAEASLRRSLGIWLKWIDAKVSVDDGPMNNLLWTLDELRHVAREERQFSGAIADHRRAIATAERLIAARPEVPRHVRLSAEFHEELAGLVSESGRPSEAMSIRLRAVPLRERALGLCQSERGRDHPETLSGRDRLSEDYAALGRWADAEALRRETLARRRKAGKPDGLLLAADLTSLGRDLLNQSRWSEAESFLREGLAIREKSAPDDWSRYAAMSLLGESLLGQGRYAEAEPLVVHGYEGMKAREGRIPIPDWARLLEVADRVVRLYEAWDRPDQVTMWKAKLGMPDLPADVFARL